MSWSSLASFAINAVSQFVFSYAANETTYDAIIVGGGVAGMVLAARLSENPKYKVLLLEAGPDPSDNPQVDTPAFAVSLWGTQFSWNFTTVPQQTLGGLTTALHQGLGFGGGSTINVMAYCRGASSVYDEWAELSGNEELRWDNILQDFRASTQVFVPEGDMGYEQVIDKSAYGKGSPLYASYEKSSQVLNVDPTFWDAFLNDKQNPAKDADLTDGTGIGLVKGGPHCVRPDNGTRWYAWPAFGHQAVGRRNAKLQHSSRVTKILFDEPAAGELGSDKPRATGVEYISTVDNSTYTVKGKEIIVAGGAVNTPWLLLLSGIGPKEHLESVGVPVVADSPDLGSNLYDHHLIPVLFKAPPEIITSSSFQNATLMQTFMAEFQANGTGPLSNPGASTFLTERVPDAILHEMAADGTDMSFYLNLPADRPHLSYQYVIGPFLPAPPDLNIVSPFVALVQPQGSGNIRLASSSWEDEPVIDPNYFGTPGDVKLILYGYERLLNITRSPAFANINVGEVYPGSSVTGSDAIRKAINPAAQTYHHVVGTCSLGKVLDSEFRVKGVNGLRVVDGSAIPVITTCHTQAPVYGLAESAARLFKKRLWV